MPASKRGTEDPLDAQAKSRRLNDDSEALDSETAPAINNSSLKELHMHETTDAVVPRSKRKLSEEEEEATEGNPAKSSRQNPPLRSTLGTPVAIHTSAFCREAPSNVVNAEFAVDNTRGDGSGDRLFSLGDELSRFKKYSSQGRTNLGFVSPQVSDRLACAPTEFVQNEHSYGRASDSSPDSMSDSTANTTKETLHFEPTAADFESTAEEKDRIQAGGQRLTANHPRASSLTESNSETAATLRSHSVGTVHSSNGGVHLEKLAHGLNCQTDSDSQCKKTIWSGPNQDLAQNTDREKQELTAGDVFTRRNDVCGEDVMPPKAIAEEIVFESCHPEASGDKNHTAESNGSPDPREAENTTDANPESKVEQLLTAARDSQTKENPTVLNTGNKIEKTTQSDSNRASKTIDASNIALERTPAGHDLESQDMASAELGAKAVCQKEFECSRAPESLPEPYSKELEDVPQEVLQGNHHAKYSLQESQIAPTEETVEAFESGTNAASHIRAIQSAMARDRNLDTLSEVFPISKEAVPTLQEALFDSHNPEGQVKSNRNLENTAHEKLTERGQTEGALMDSPMLKQNFAATQAVPVEGFDAQMDETQIDSPVQEYVKVECVGHPEIEVRVSENRPLSTEPRPTPQEVLPEQFSAGNQLEELGETPKSQNEERKPISDRNPVCPVEENVLASPSLSQETENAPKEVLVQRFYTESQVEMASKEENQMEVEAAKNLESRVRDLSLTQETQAVPQEVLIRSCNPGQRQTESDNNAENAIVSYRNLRRHADLPLSQEAQATAQEIPQGSRMSQGEMECDKPGECQLEQSFASVESGNPSLSKQIEPTPQELLTGRLNAGVQVEDHSVGLNKNRLIIESSGRIERDVAKQTDAAPQEALGDNLNVQSPFEEKRAEPECRIHANSSEQKQEQVENSRDAIHSTSDVLMPVCEAALRQNRTKEMPREYVIISLQRTDVEMPSEATLPVASPQEEIGHRSSQNVNDATNKDMMSGNSSGLEKEMMRREYSTATLSETRNTTSAASPAYPLEIDPHSGNHPNKIHLGITQTVQNEDKKSLQYIAEDLNVSNAEVVQGINLGASLEVSDRSAGVIVANFKNSTSEEFMAVMENPPEAHQGGQMDVSPSCHIHGNNVNSVPATPVSPADFQMKSTEDLLPSLQESNQIVKSELNMYPAANTSSEALVEDKQEETKLLDAHENRTESPDDMEHEDAVAQERQTSYETQNLEGQMVETSHLEIQHESELPHDVCQDAMSSDELNLQHACLLDRPQTASAPSDSDSTGSCEVQKDAELAQGACEVQTGPHFTANGCHDNKDTTQRTTQVEMGGEEDVQKKDSESTFVVSVSENNQVAEFITRSLNAAANQAEMDITEPLDSGFIPASLEELQVQDEDNLCVISEVQLKPVIAETADTSGDERDQVAKVAFAIVDSRNLVLDHFVLSESVHSSLEEETEGHDGDTSAMTVSSQASESHEVQVLVFAQPTDIAPAPKTSEEQVENQIVYEPISSPESNGDADAEMSFEQQGLVSLRDTPSVEDTAALSTHECMASSLSQLENEEIAQEKQADAQTAFEMVTFPPTNVVSETAACGETATPLENQGGMENTPNAMKDLSTCESMKTIPLQTDNNETPKEEPTDKRTEFKRTTTVWESCGVAAAALDKEASTQNTKEDLPANESVDDGDSQLENGTSAKEEQADGNTAVETEVQDTREDLTVNESVDDGDSQLENYTSAKEEQADGNAAVETEVQQSTQVSESGPDNSKDGEASVVFEKQYLMSSSVQEVNEDLSTNESKNANQLHLANNTTTAEGGPTDNQTAVETEEVQHTTTVPEKNAEAATDLAKQDCVSIEDIPSSQDKKKDSIPNVSMKVRLFQAENDEGVQVQHTDGQAAVEMVVQQTAALLVSSPDGKRDTDGAVTLERQDLVSSEDVPSKQERKEAWSPNESIGHLHLGYTRTTNDGIADQMAVEMEEERQTIAVPESNGESATVLEKQDLLSLVDLPSNQDKKEDMLTNESVVSPLQLENVERAKEDQADGQAAVEMEESSHYSNKDSGVALALEKQDLVFSEDVLSNRNPKQDSSPNERVETSRLHLESKKTAGEEWTDVQAGVDMEVEETTTVSKTSLESDQAGDIVAGLENQDLVSLDMKGSLQLENGATTGEERTEVQAVVDVEVEEMTTVPKTIPESNQARDIVVGLENQDLVSSDMKGSLQLENEATAGEERTEVQAVVDMEVEQTTILSTTSPESDQAGDVAAGLEKQDLVSLDMKGSMRLESEATTEKHTKCQTAVETAVQGPAIVLETSLEKNKDGAGAAGSENRDFVSSWNVSSTQNAKDHDLHGEKKKMLNELTDGKAAVETVELQQSPTLPECSSQSAAAIIAPDGDAHDEKGVFFASVSERLQDDLPVTAPSALSAVDLPNDSSEEYVILKPVPEGKLSLDIVSQAAVASGLSDPSLVSRVDPNASLTEANRTQQNCLLKTQEAAPEVQVAAVTSSEEAEALPTPPLEKLVEPTPDNFLQPPSVIEMANTQPQGRDFGAPEEDRGDGALQELQILEDMEIGHEIIVVEVGHEEDNDLMIVDKTATQAPSLQKPIEYSANEDSLKICNSTLNPDVDCKTFLEKPKKQEMNTQARTKARLAALAEQKAAAMRRTANKQQLNLLALCQEIAEDIATDSMLLKRIEEEKQAVAKVDTAKKENPPVSAQEVAPVDVKPPAEAQSSSVQAPPAEEPPAAQPLGAESKPAEEPPKRRFFVSQVSVPLKAHEKKKLTRYQRLRQVELQREKMSWARMKKMKSDQANQISDMDWQASMFTSAPFSSNATIADPAPRASPPPLSSPALSSKPASPKSEAPGSLQNEAAKKETPKVDAFKTEPEVKTEPSKGETQPTEPAKTEFTRITRQSSKAQMAKATPPPNPTPKVTRSSTRRSLPAVPPPMPNGLKASKPQPVEYKPYKPRPRYSPDDFELDDDPLPAPPKRSAPQSSPPAHSKVTLQPGGQVKLKASTASAALGQIPSQSKGAVSTPAQSKPGCAPAPQHPVPASAQSKDPVPSAPPKPAPPSHAPSQSKPTSAVTRSNRAACAAPRVQTAGAAPAQTDRPAASDASPMKPGLLPAADGVPAPAKFQAAKDKESQASAGLSSSSPTESPPPLEESSNPPDMLQCEDELAVADQCQKAVQDGHVPEASSQDGVATQQDVAPPQPEAKKPTEGDKDDSETVTDGAQKPFGAEACGVCGMLYSAANPEDQSQHLLFHNQFVSAVKYVGWKKERILGEFPDGKIILVLPDDPKYALKKVEEIREMVDNDLGFQQVGTKCPSLTKTFLFITNDKKVAGCLIAEHISEGYRVIEEPRPQGSEGDKLMLERQGAWCCSTTAEPALCGISRIWVVSVMRRRAIASRLLECLRNNFIYGSYLSKDEIAFSDPTPDGKLFATHYFGTSRFLVYNFVSGTHARQPKSQALRRSGPDSPKDV